MQRMYEELTAGLPKLGIMLDEADCRRLCDFGEAMVRQNEVMNLTAITESGQVARLHLLDSLTVMKAVDLEGKSLIDVGTGAGFPGVPLAIACPNTQVTLLDALAKRMNWLSGEISRLELSARCVTARAEEAAAECRESYDYAVSRAVARLNILLELTAPFVKVGGAVVALKGAAAEEELAEAENAVKKLGLKVEKLVPFPQVEQGHTVIVLRKVAPTPARYPRRYAKIKASPL